MSSLTTHLAAVHSSPDSFPATKQLWASTSGTCQYNNHIYRTSTQYSDDNFLLFNSIYEVETFRRSLWCLYPVVGCPPQYATFTWSGTTTLGSSGTGFYGSDALLQPN